MRVVITNVVALNGGDAAILVAIVKLLRLAFGDGIEIVVLDPQAEAAQRYLPDLAFQPMFQPRGGRRGRWDRLRMALGRHAPALAPAQARRNLDLFRNADLVVSTGGTYLVEHYDMSAKLLQLELAAATAAPVVMFTQSLGPFRAPETRARLKALLPRMGLVLLRDERSLGHLQDLGAGPIKARVSADAAFALADPQDLAGQPSGKPAGPPQIAISVRPWRRFSAGEADDKMQTYADSIAAAAIRLVRERQARITFISTCQGAPEYSTDDAAVAAAIAAGLPADVAPSVSVDRRHRTPQALIDTLKPFDLVIATRMHMAILALDAGRPVLPIAYEFKTAELFDRLGFGDWVADIETITPEPFADRALRALDELPGRTPDLHRAVLAEQREALTAVEQLRQLV